MKSIARIAGKWGLPIVEFDVEGHTNVAVGDKAKQQSQSTMMISEGRAKAVPKRQVQVDWFIEVEDCN